MIKESGLSKEEEIPQIRMIPNLGLGLRVGNQFIQTIKMPGIGIFTQSHILSQEEGGEEISPNEPPSLP